MSGAEQRTKLPRLIASGGRRGNARDAGAEGRGLILPRAGRRRGTSWRNPYNLATVAFCSGAHSPVALSPRADARLCRLADLLIRLLFLADGIDNRGHLRH